MNPAWKFPNVKVGDILYRKLPTIPTLEVVVTKVKGSVITVEPKVLREEERKGMEDLVKSLGLPVFEEMPTPNWTFSMVTGGEIDTDLGWDGITATGSTLHFKEEVS